MDWENIRRDPRQPIQLPLRLITPSGETAGFTEGISRNGFSFQLSQPMAVGQQVQVRFYLPSGSEVRGSAVCRNQRPGGIAGFSLSIDAAGAQVWNDFVDQEEATGNLWRMLNRYLEAGEDESADLRSVTTRGRYGALLQAGGVEFGGWLSGATAQQLVSLRLHTVGENGEAYRIIFEKHPSDEPAASDLCHKMPGFLELAERSVRRVLRENVLIRLNDRTPVKPVRIAELARGNFAFVQRGDAATGDCGLVSLGFGELILVEIDGRPIFPNFTVDELERIACDNVRLDLDRPMFRSVEASATNTELQRQPKSDNPFDDGVDTQPDAIDRQAVSTAGIEAVRFAQARADQVQTRIYGERSIKLFPEIWARARDREGNQVMGPTMEDGPRVCVLALVGPNTPRVVKLDDDSQVELLKSAPRGRAA
ncbi:MAG: PilZ domain-containing protein [Deltaproteobacteria bacterium]|nr:PilZ domain-containing protein [Deltaproteobacteria bacterium]